MLLVVGMGLDQRILVEEARILPMKNLGTEKTADLVIDGIAQHGGGQQDSHEGHDIHASLADCGQRTGHEKQGIARQERGHDETGFGEDDEEENAIDPQPVLLNQDGEVLVEMKDDIDELGEEFHADCRALIEAAL